MNTRLTARPSGRSARRQRWTVRRGTKRLRRSWRAGARWGRRRAARGSARSRPGPGRRRLAARAPPPADRRPPARSHARMLVVGCAAAGADQRDGGVHGRGRSRDVTSTSTRSRSRARSVPPSARGPLGVQCPRNDVRAGSTIHGRQAAPRSQPSRAAAALPRGAWAAVARAHPGAPPGRRHHGLRQPSQASRRRPSASHAFERVLVGHERRYVKGNVYDAPRELLGMGLVTLEGDAWKERRRLMQPHFHRAAPRRAETSRAWRQTAIWSAPSALTSAPAGRSRMGRLESLPPTSSS
jgi:hypothetical protein